MLFLYFKFWTSMWKLNLILISLLTGKCSTYQGAKIEIIIFGLGASERTFSCNCFNSYNLTIYFLQIENYESNSRIVVNEIEIKGLKYGSTIFFSL